MKFTVYKIYASVSELKYLIFNYVIMLYFSGIQFYNKETLTLLKIVSFLSPHQELQSLLLMSVTVIPQDSRIRPLRSEKLKD